MQGALLEIGSAQGRYLWVTDQSVMIKVVDHRSGSGGILWKLKLCSNWLILCVVAGFVVIVLTGYDLTEMISLLYQ